MAVKFIILNSPGEVLNNDIFRSVSKKYKYNANNYYANFSVEHYLVFSLILFYVTQ